MVPVVSEFLSIVGVDAIVPSNLAELVPYLLNVFVGVVLVTAVFRVVSAIASSLISMRRV